MRTKLVLRDLPVANQLRTKELENVQGGASKSIRIRANIKGDETEVKAMMSHPMEPIRPKKGQTKEFRIFGRLFSLNQMGVK